MPPIEIIEKRTRNSKTYYLGKNRYRLEVYGNDPTLTVQPSAKDTYLYSPDPDGNYGTDAQLRLNDKSIYTQRPILEFDISDLPAGATLISATLQLYYFYCDAPSAGKTVWAYKLTRTNWVETEATWNSYKTGSSWTTKGGDYVTFNPSGGKTTVPASFGWMSWGVLAIVQDAYDSANPAEFLVKFETEELPSGGVLVIFHSNNYTGDASLCPKLVIEYTAAPPAYIPRHSGTVGVLII